MLFIVCLGWLAGQLAGGAAAASFPFPGASLTPGFTVTFAGLPGMAQVRGGSGLPDLRGLLLNIGKVLLKI